MNSTWTTGRGGPAITESVRPAPRRQSYGGAVGVGLAFAVLALWYPPMWIGTVVCALVTASAIRWNRALSVPSRQATKLCPHCRSFIPASATACGFCRHAVLVAARLGA